MSWNCDGRSYNRLALFWSLYACQNVSLTWKDVWLVWHCLRELTSRSSRLNSQSFTSRTVLGFLYFVEFNWGNYLVSTQTHVVIICDAVAKSSVNILLSKYHRIPYSWQRLSPPPPTHTCNFSWRTLGVSFPRILPSHPRIRLLMENIGTSVLSYSRIPPPQIIGTSYGWLCRGLVYGD